MECYLTNFFVRFDNFSVDNGLLKALKCEHEQEWQIIHQC